MTRSTESIKVIQVGPAPLRSSLGVVELPNAGVGNRTFIAMYGYEADGIIAVNHGRLHTDYRDSPESGSLKLFRLTARML